MYFHSLGLCYEHDLYKLADIVCDMRESTLDYIDPEQIMYLYDILNEELGEKFLKRTYNMQENHRNRDFHISRNDILRRQIPIYIDHDKIRLLKHKMKPHIEKITDKVKNHINEMINDFESYINKYGENHPKTLKKQKEIEDLIEKVQFYSRNGGINRKTYEELEKKHCLIFINGQGGTSKPDEGPIKIDYKPKGGDYVSTETAHNKRNNRIGPAKDRLEKYLKKKGYDDDTYAKEHDKMVGTRVNPARERLIQRSKNSVNYPIINIEQSPIYATGTIISKQQYRDDGTLR